MSWRQLRLEALVLHVSRHIKHHHLENGIRGRGKTEVSVKNSVSITNFRLKLLELSASEVEGQQFFFSSNAVSSSLLLQGVH